MEKIDANSNSAALSCLTWIKNNEIEKFRLKLSNCLTITVLQYVTILSSAFRCTVLYKVLFSSLLKISLVVFSLGLLGVKGLTGSAADRNDQISYQETAQIDS